MLISKKAYEDWREIQADYEPYMASLGPWPLDELVNYLTAEYPEKADRMREVVLAFAESHSLTFEVQ